MNINTKLALVEFRLVGTNKRRVHYRFISFRTYGTGVVQYDTKAFMSDDMKALNMAICLEVEILLANGHTNITVHETCDAKTLKEWNIAICRV